MTARTSGGITPAEEAQGPCIADLPSMRAAMAAQARTLPAPEVHTQDLDGATVPVRLYKPPVAADEDPSGLPLLVFLHGGGWMLGDLETHDACCRSLCAQARCAILAVEYRLAPEHPYPAGLDDVAAAFLWARRTASALGCDPQRIAIGGESAGANLAAALTLLLRDRGEPQPLFQFLVHPPTDLNQTLPSIDEVHLPGLTRPFLDLCVQAYTAGASLDEPLISPLRARDLAHLAPAIIVTVEVDPLRDDGETYALALARAGNEVSLQRLPGLAHGFMFLSTTIPAIEASFRLLGARVARYFRAP